MSNSGSQATRILSWILLLLVLVYSAWVGYLLFTRAPKFETIFADFNTPLPQLTIWFLSPWPKWIIAGVPAFALVKQLLIRNGAFNLTINGLLLAGLFIFERLMTDALWLPLMALTKAMGGGH